MAPGRETPMPVNVTVDIPISAITAIRNATNDEELRPAFRMVAPMIRRAALTAIRKPHKHTVGVSKVRYLYVPTCADSIIRTHT